MNLISGTGLASADGWSDCDGVYWEDESLILSRFWRSSLIGIAMVARGDGSWGLLVVFS